MSGPFLSGAADPHPPFGHPLPRGRGIARIAIGGIRAYKRWISPLLPASCRFEPTCSVYAMGCYQRFGLAKATYLTLRRLSRCHPFHPGGHDPVPGGDAKN